MNTVVIGIHGLRNKPPKYILTDWWKKSIIEGFRVIHLPPPRFKFEMAFWAHYMHPRQQDASVKDPADPRFLWEPYVPGTYFGPREPEPFRKKLSHTIRQQLVKLIAGKSGFMNVNAVSDIILHRMFIELDIYYHHQLRDAEGGFRPAAELIRGELARLLRKHRKKSICILAHSMGCIIAYDVMQHVTPDIPIHTFMTFGAPLGFPVIIKKIKHEMGLDAGGSTPLPTPESIRRRWLNFADLEDVTCLNYNLRNNYRENSAGVRPFDIIVYNNYEYNGCKNPHKIYGYLRTAEFTQAMNNFLVLENAGLWERMKWVIKGPKT